MSHVLVLVADETVRELRKLVLRGAGFQVEAPELSAASGIIETSAFDALVVSRLEPDTACEFIAEFRRRNPQGRVVAIAAAGRGQVWPICVPSHVRCWCSTRMRTMADAAVEPYDPSGLIRALQLQSGKANG
jgi:CheY-like chemotaxis protein